MDFVSKLAPFRTGNRMWVAVLMQGYGICLLSSVALAALLNTLEGEAWMDADRGASQDAKGDSAMDECLWFVFMTLHGIGFGEFMPRDTPGHMIAMLTISVGYLFMIFMMAIIMLSQLPGAKTPSLIGVVTQVASTVWPSYLVFILLIVGCGSFLGPYVSDAPSGFNDYATGIYWLWCVMHRAPYGDIWPNTPLGRTITVPAAMLSYLYPPYALAVIAVRRPSSSEHQQLLEHMNAHPEDAMGPGYIVPSMAREVQMSQQ
eukprot:TRINITY_DN18596_c0_g1_i1.p1 TRINITY_DN18596_c0_g1~~TRINITY_DN18596_c0_g1_i1.p1  ORF type:complete len:260 (+),score=35.20 TRINITY_DN18596_c0_g1_i1:80-859(+)